MAIKKPAPPAPDEELPEDYYDTFHGRGQDLQDQEDLDKGLLPSMPDERRENTQRNVGK